MFYFTRPSFLRNNLPVVSRGGALTYLTFILVDFAMTADDVTSGKTDRVRDRGYPPENASTRQDRRVQSPATIIGDPVQGDRTLEHELRLVLWVVACFPT